MAMFSIASDKTVNQAVLIIPVFFSPDVLNGTVTFLPLEEDDRGNVRVETSNVYQIRLSQSQEEW